MDSCYVTPKEDMHKGAYIIADPHKGLRDGALLFDAAQEELARKAAMYLAVQGIALRLIRVDDFERFMAQEQEYRNRLLGGFPAAVIKNVSWAEALGINAARGETPAELASTVKEAILLKYWSQKPYSIFFNTYFTDCTLNLHFLATFC